MESQDENGDFGVELDGYTGTGYFKPGELEPLKGAVGKRAKNRNPYQDQYMQYLNDDMDEGEKDPTELW